ncbi:MAG: response regulator [Planctomycetes bacterium]|nr:response regulator [Planctomycetota bacterium]
MERWNGLRGPRVLVAEDDPSWRAVCQLLLEQAGMRVTTARDGGEAISVIEAAAREGVHYDLLLLDIRMPVASGWDVLRRSREVTPPGAHPPRVLLMTGFSVDLDIDRVNREGASSVLIKPISNTVLLFEIGRTFSAPREPASIPTPGPGER